MKGVNACEEFLNTRTYQSPPTKDLRQLIQLILESNAFIFKGACYLQLQGTPMGIRMAPSYTNFFIGKFEQQFLRTQNKLPLVWWRYIDDVFTIWTHGVPCLNMFLRELNNYHTTIKFKADWSAQEVTFLEDGRVEMDLHVKPTSKHQYLHTKSCRPKHCKTAIPNSQALRIKRICSE